MFQIQVVLSARQGLSKFEHVNKKAIDQWTPQGLMFPEDTGRSLVNIRCAHINTILQKYRNDREHMHTHTHTHTASWDEMLTWPAICFLGVFNIQQGGLWGLHRGTKCQMLSHQLVAMVKLGKGISCDFGRLLSVSNSEHILNIY